MASLDEELDEDLLASRSWLAKLGGRRLQAPKARGPAPSVARWLADRGALTAKTERPSASRVMPVLPGAPAVHLLGAKTARRRGKCRLHRVLAGKGSEEFKEDLEALSLRLLDLATTPKRESGSRKDLGAVCTWSQHRLRKCLLHWTRCTARASPTRQKTDASTIYDVRLFRKQHVPVTKLGCQRGEAT